MLTPHSRITVYIVVTIENTGENEGEIWLIFFSICKCELWVGGLRHEI